MKTQTLIDLQRNRLDAIQEARSILAEIEAEKDVAKLRDLENRHNRAMRAIDLIDLDIREEEMLAESEAERARNRPDMGGRIGYGVDDGLSDIARAWAGENRTGWVDDKGKAVRVLRPDECLATERATGVGLGDAVRAMLTGPRNELEKRALAEGTNSAGGYTVPTPLAAWFIDRLRAQSVAVRAGAMTVPMSSETLAIARLETDPTIGWRAENAAVAEGDPTFGRVLLTAKSLAGIVKISRELMADTVNLGAILEQALAKTMALEIDRAAIFGDGTSNSPTGVWHTSGINTVSMGTNGAAPTDYTKLIDAIYELQLDNAADPTAQIMHPRTNAALAKLNNGNGDPLPVPEMVAKVPKLITTAAPIDETEGAANNASSIVFGDFRQMFIGMREDINIRLLDQVYAANGQIALLVHARVDVQLALPKSFCTLTGIIP